ncbi:MAG TPA: hypothetical protein V6C96_04935 [Vampirovibrionales bacterium]
MNKQFLNLLLIGFVLISGLSLKVKANNFFGYGAAGGFNNVGNPVYSQGGPSPIWGGGYNLNSLSAGGWGGYPAGYANPYPQQQAPMYQQPAPRQNGGMPLTGGFGGFYSPFLR